MQLLPLLLTCNINFQSGYISLHFWFQINTITSVVVHNFLFNKRMIEFPANYFYRNANNSHDYLFDKTTTLTVSVVKYIINVKHI